VPAYNEESRLPPMMSATFAFLASWPECSAAQPAEVVVVSDGSTDGTAAAVRALRPPPHVSVRLLELTRNRGKGAAIRTGVLSTASAHVLMVDADGASRIEDLALLLSSLRSLPPSPAGRACLGSRAHLSEGSAASRSLARTLLMRAFHLFVGLLCSRAIRDTQCGFKLFDRRAADLLFGALHLDRWAFDVELVALAEALGVALGEVGVGWEEVGGSKLDTGKVALAWNAVGMLRDMLCVRVCYAAGLWKVPEVGKDKSA
jgi:dolichyl-phosphate beta-glucosyltransferase